MDIWKSSVNTAEEALNLPAGKLICNLGGLRFEETPKPDDVLLAAQAIILAEETIIAASQARVMKEAQERELAFTNWAATFE